MKSAAVCLGVTMVVIGGSALLSARQGRNEAPERFSINAQMKGTAGAAGANLTVQVDRYSSDKDRDAALKALASGGSAALKPVLAKAPALGHVEVTDQKWTIKYAYQQPTTKGRRRIVLLVDEPMFFIGGAKKDAKPREGYDVALVQFEIDDVGLGKGTMAAAAKLAAGGPDGVQVADYADRPIELVTVRKLIK